MIRGAQVACFIAFQALLAVVLFGFVAGQLCCIRISPGKVAQKTPQLWVDQFGFLFQYGPTAQTSDHDRRSFRVFPRTETNWQVALADTNPAWIGNFAVYCDWTAAPSHARFRILAVRHEPLLAIALVVVLLDCWLITRWVRRRAASATT